VAQPRQPADQPSLLLLGLSPAWIGAVAREAASLGVQHIVAAGTAEEAVLRLAGGSPSVSHLLIQDSFCDALLPQLVDLTAGEAPSRCALVVLGTGDRLTRDRSALAMQFVREHSQGWLQRILAPAPAPIPRQDRLSMEELREALSGARIQTRYQPIVRMHDSQPVGLEVLARLEHPVRGILPPDLFVPQIEDAGLAWPLTEAVIRRAFEDWGGGRLEAFGLTLAINFPLDVLLIPEALVWLEEQRKACGLSAEHLVIELTESRPVTQIPMLRQAVTTLRGIGYGLAIDDVGPELRDHQALLDLQFTALKLDKELVRESPDSLVASTFLNQTIEAARAANLTIVAEGVEDGDIWRRMAALGVDQAQGFLVARPLPAAAVPLWHRDWCERFAR
jgi:EAL domain-containing protein (putative c-di-GMP-specific phosphodiesterase class I)